MRRIGSQRQIEEHYHSNKGEGAVCKHSVISLRKGGTGKGLPNLGNQTKGTNDQGWRLFCEKP